MARRSSRTVLPGGAVGGHPGFTLIEMIISMTIVMVLMVATYSVMRLAARVVPNPGNPQTCTLNGARALDQINGDLAYATAVLELQARSVTFKVPDRNGDSVEETLKYAWSGTAGAPLTISINGAAGSPIAEDVREFDLSATKGARVTAPVYTWGNETLLISHDFLLNLGSGVVTSTNWYGEYILPVFASDVRRWKITRVRLPMKSNGTADGTAMVQIQNASGGLPTGAVLDQTPLTENGLGGLLHSWQSFTFNSAPAVASTAGLCVVVQWGSGASACDLQFQNLLYSGANATLVTTTNGGGSWTAPAGQSLLYEVYGKVEKVQLGSSQAFVEQVACVLRLGASSSSRVETVVSLVNEPGAP